MLQLNENGHWDEQIIASIHRDIVNKYCSITVVVSKIPSLSVEQIILLLNRLLDGRVLALIASVPGSIPSQGTHHTKDVIKMVPVVPLFSTEH